MLKFYVNNLRLHNKSARDLISYFRRYYDIFFGNHPDEILKYAPHKRSWILQSIKKLAQYYKYKTGNPDCEDVVRKMIERYNLNVSLDMKRAIYVVDDEYVVCLKKIKTKGQPDKVRQQRDDYARELMSERLDKVMDVYNNCWIPDN